MVALTSFRRLALLALSGASAVCAAEQQQQAAAASGPTQTSPPVVLPTDLLNGFKYSDISELAARLPSQLNGGRDQQEHTNMPLRVPSGDDSEASSRRRAGSLKVLIAGDSMSQGKEGDYTWRYRISEWFQSQNIGVDFVGPYKGTRQPPDTLPPQAPALKGVKNEDNRIIADGGYAAGISFDSDHFAIWGRACAADVGLIQDVVKNGQPDVMLVMLGFNDLGWFYSDDKGLLNNMYSFIQNARAGNPNIKIALANVPQRSSLGRDDLPAKTDAYNKALVDAIPKWSTDQSPISLVKLRENYDCELGGCAAGYDGLHPNAKGEYQIARAFSLTLVNDMKIGSSPLVVPGNIPTRPVPVPSNYRLATSPQGVTATWDKVYGAYGYNVKFRIAGFTDWQVVNIPIPRWDPQWALGNITYEVQVQTACGEGCAGDWTAVQSAASVPQTAAAPKNVVTKEAGSGAVQLTWDASTGPNSDSVSEYFVLTWDLTVPCSWIGGYAYTSSPAVVDGLVPGHMYMFAVSTWNKNGESFPNVLPKRIVGGGTPGAPGIPTIQAADGGSTAHVTWDAVAGAAGYYLWTRNINNASDYSKPQDFAPRDTNCGDSGWMFPGVWNYEFCIQAFNGDSLGPKGPCATGSKNENNAAVPTCTTPTKQNSGCKFGDIPTFTNQPTNYPTSKPIHQHEPTKTRSVLTPTDSIRPWQTVDCGDNAVTNIQRESGATFWKALDVNKAWSDATGFFISDKERPASQEFSEELAMYFNVTTNNYKCRVLTFGNDPACKIPIGCPDANSPAGWAIMNSIVGIERIISNLAAAISGTEASVSDQVSKIVDDFGNIPDGKLDAILGMVSMGLGFLGTPAFGDLIKGLNNFAKESGDALNGLKDAATNLAGQAIGMVKQAETGNPTAISESNSLRVNIQGIIRIWEESLKAYADKLFNGTPESITSILHIIVDGSTFNTASTATIDVQKGVERAIFPQLIYQAWILGKSSPFILVTGDSCKAGDAPPKKTPAPKEGYACVNGKIYYLTSAPGSYYTNPNCYQHPVTSCTPTGYKNVPGVSKLDGKVWGGITVQDFVEGSLNTWGQNGQKNNGGKNSPDFASGIVGTIYDNPAGSYRIPGVFAIPVCGDGEAQSNWKKDTRGTYFPCSG